MGVVDVRLFAPLKKTRLVVLQQSLLDTCKPTKIHESPFSKSDLEDRLQELQEHGRRGDEEVICEEKRKTMGEELKNAICKLINTVSTFYFTPKTRSNWPTSRHREI